MTYTSNNIYNGYHEKLVNLIINDDTQIITAYFKLEPQDILNLRLSESIYLMGETYIIDKVQDYNPQANGMTKVSLIKRTV